MCIPAEGNFHRLQIDVLFFCSVFSIICCVIFISNYRRPAWEAKAFQAAFHIVFAICMYMYFFATYIVENKIFLTVIISLLICHDHCKTAGILVIVLLTHDQEVVGSTPSHITVI